MREHLLWTLSGKLWRYGAYITLISWYLCSSSYCFSVFLVFTYKGLKAKCNQSKLCWLMVSRNVKWLSKTKSFWDCFIFLTLKAFHELNDLLIIFWLVIDLLFQNLHCSLLSLWAHLFGFAQSTNVIILLSERPCCIQIPKIKKIN